MVFQFDRERTILGSVFTHAGEEELALSALDRMNHMLVIGKTGMGKTRILRNIIVQDIHTGRGIGVIDPHGCYPTPIHSRYTRTTLPLRLAHLSELSNRRNEEDKEQDVQRVLRRAVRESARNA
jgi:hypothetical protein